MKKNKDELESILPNFFLRKRRIFPFFADKLGHFIANVFYPICNKRSSLLLKRKNESLVGLTPGLNFDLTTLIIILAVTSKSVLKIREAFFSVLIRTLKLLYFILFFDYLA